jgi:glycosyltransferase involved in cell wall biosynthesis
MSRIVQHAIRQPGVRAQGIPVDDAAGATVAVIAHDLAPDLGSEAGNAWELALGFERRSARKILFVVASANQLGTVDYSKRISGKNIDFRRVEFVFVPYTRWERLSARVGRAFLFRHSPVGNPFVYSMLYRRWLRRAHGFATARASVKVVHLLNHISFRWPLEGPFPDQDSMRYLWGPTGGVTEIPSRYTGSFGFFSRFKTFLSNHGLRIKRNARSVARFASRCERIFAVSRDDVDYFLRFNRSVSQRVDVFAELPPENDRSKRKAQSVLELLFVGRLDERKGVDLAIDAVRGLGGVHLTIVGSGALEGAMRRRCKQHSIDNVTFVGKVDKAVVADYMSGADLLLHPSIREAGATVVLEALGRSLPVVCHRAFGMEYYVSEECGYLIEMENPESSVAQIRALLKRLRVDRSELRLKSAAARHAAEGCSPEKFVDALLEAYR